MKLLTGTQHLFYKIRLTMVNIAMTQYTICNINGESPTSDQIWLSIRAREIQTSKCGLCDSPESMEHILLNCDKLSASRIIWKAVSNLWCKRDPNWPVIHFGTILGWNLATFSNTKGKTKVGTTRLFKILTIKYGGDKEKYHSDTKIINRWIHAINMRLKFNWLLTNSTRYRKKAIKIDTVPQTWSGLLKNEDSLPDNWI
ncbi:hypothetical protein F4604DRAFT_1973370 [Suillus subluteus]|nr:hypothetical protein F4604DRAFT_1973370 [Suillus subluteus]